MLDFGELSQDGRDLELLMREILVSCGYEVQWSGTGLDEGRALICVERRDSVFVPDETRWLIRCRQNANSGKAVGIGDLGDVVDACVQHGCTGFLLACSTYPSSAVLDRLEAISQNSGKKATSWDAAKLEQVLNTPRTWPLAQRFFPVSANSQDWRIYATESPNNWVVNYKGYYFHLNTRAGSRIECHLDTVRNRIADLQKIEFGKDGHCLRIRAAYLDDQEGSCKWYIDYMYPHDQEASRTTVEIEQTLGSGLALEDGQVHYFDVVNRCYDPLRDHHSLDHHEYYSSHRGSFATGFDRPLEASARRDRFLADQEHERTLEITRERDFNSLLAKFTDLEFLNVVRSANSEIEYLDRFHRQFDWSRIIEDVCLEPDRFFSVWFLFDVKDEARFHELVTFFPQKVEYQFRVTKPRIYVPNDGGTGCRMWDDDGSNLHEITFSIHRNCVESKVVGRKLINEHLRKVGAAIDRFCEQSPGS